MNGIIKTSQETPQMNSPVLSSSDYYYCYYMELLWDYSPI